MRRIAISHFKATCLAVLEDVRTTGEPVIVTRRGVPVAQVNPPAESDVPRRRLGVMEGRGRIIGDIIAPAAEPSEWDVLK